LNIGKPFHLEGIGTITKNRSGKFDFTPGEYTVFKENTPAPDHDKKKLYPSEKKQLNTPPSIQNRNILKVAALIAALIIVGLGGLMMYKKNNPGVTGNNQDTSSVVQAQQPSANDSLAAVSTARRDSIKNSTKDSGHLSTVNDQRLTYKFVILTTYNKPHALRRYKQLIGFDLKAHLYQKDSTFFKVYFQFPALAKDTIQIKDSLRKQYAHEVTIEQ
jgi:hypothetical protein